MKFEILNQNKKVIMYCSSIECIPNEDEILSMTKAGYKFKIDGKIANKKQIIELKNNKQNKISM